MEYPIVAFAEQAAWMRWLEANHDAADGVWIKFAKKKSGIASLNYDEALGEALCFGWIDSQVKTVDEDFYMQKFTPRRAKSKWSQINCAKAIQLIAAGKMRPSGLRQVELAKADGRWDAAYAGPAAIGVPADLQAA